MKCGGFRMKLRKPALKMDSVKITSKIVFFRSFFFASFVPFLVSLLFERFVLLDNPDRTFSG